MSKYYQVCQCHSPSGGMSLVDETKYATLEEARGAAQALLSQVGKFQLYNVDGKSYAYPHYWAQGFNETINGVTHLE